MQQFEEIDVLTLLPQRPPFVMIDKLLYCDKEVTKTAFLIREDSIFCDNGWLTESGLAENIAQTCAARMGYINIYILKNTVKLGFIGAIRNMEFLRLPRAGETVTTQITVMEEVFKMTLVTAQVTVGEELVASSEMKISITDIDSGKQEQTS